MQSSPRAAFKTTGFGHAPEREAHHFVVSVPRSPTSEVMIYEVFAQDVDGPVLDAANLRARLDLGRWLKVAENSPIACGPRICPSPPGTTSGRR